MHYKSKVPSCPVCNTRYRNDSVTWWLKGKNDVWSDGYRPYDISHEFPLITCCNECYNYFWVSAADNPCFREYRGSSLAIKRIDLNSEISYCSLRKLTAEEYAEALALRVYRDPDEERYLRFNLWWSINSLVRNGKAGEISRQIQELFEENLETLIYKTNPDCPESLMMLAEMHRELGLFNEAAKILDRINKNVSGNEAAVKIRQRIAMEDKQVFLI